MATLLFNDFLDRIFKSVKNLEVQIYRDEINSASRKILDALRPAFKVIDRPPAPSETFKVYIIVSDAQYAQLFVNDDPANEPKSNLQAWQYAIAGQDFNAPSARRNNDGSKVIFTFFVNRDQGVEMVQWFNARPALINSMKPSLMLRDPEADPLGHEAFREYLNSTAEWNAV